MKRYEKVKRLLLFGLAFVTLFSNVPGSTIVVLADEHMGEVGHEEANEPTGSPDAAEIPDIELREPAEEAESQPAEPETGQGGQNIEEPEASGSEAREPGVPEAETTPRPDLEGEEVQEQEGQPLKEVEKAGEILSFSDTQSEDQNEFSLTPNISLPAGSTGNKVVIELPAGIKVVKAPELDEVLTGYDQQDNADGSAVITMTFKDVMSAGMIGKGVGLSQEEFIKTSKTAAYTIRVSFQNDQGSTEEKEKTYSAKIDYEKAIAAEVNGSIDGFLLIDDGAAWELEAHTGFDLTEDEYKGKVVLEPATFEKLRLKGEGLKENPDGSVEIPITQDMIKDERTLTIPLPLEVDRDKIDNLLTERHQFSILGNVTFESGQIGVFDQKFENVYLTTQRGVGFPESYSLFDLLKKNIDAKLMDVELYGRYKSAEYTWSEAQISILKKYLLSTGVISFQLPKYMSWEGNGAYDEAANTVVLSESAISLTADKYRKNLFLNFMFKARIDYDPSIDDNLKDITKENFGFSNMSFTWGEDSKKEKFIYSNVDNSRIFQRDTGIFRSDYRTVKQGSSNVLLGGIKYYNTNNYFLPPYEYSFDFTQNYSFQSGEKPYTDIFQITKMEADTSFLMDSLKGENIAVFYTTNKNPDQRLWNIYDRSSVEFGEGEWLTGFSLTSEGTDSAIINDSNHTIISFYGDVSSNGYEGNEKVTGNTIHSFIGESKDAEVKYRNGFQLVDLNITPEKDYQITDESFVMKDLAWYEIYPEFEREGQITMLPLPDSESAEEITYSYSENNTASRLRIRSIQRGVASNDAIFKIEYTTKNDSVSKKKELKAGEKVRLPEGDYFTMLKFTRSAKKRMNVSFDVYMPTEYAPEEDVALGYTGSMFEIVETNGVSGNVRALGEFKAYNRVSQSAVLGYGAKKANSIDLSTLNAGAKVIIPMRFNVRSEQEGIEVEGDNLVINPVFYIEIPEDFEFSDLLLSESLKDKTPEITTFTYNNKAYAKVRFYGDPDGATGFKSGSLSKGITLELKVKKFARAGKNSSVALKAFVDQSESLERFNDPAKRMKGDFLYTSSLEEASVYDVAADKKIRVISDKSESTVVNYEVLQTTETLIESSVNKEGETAAGNQVAIKNGESFEATINIFNGSTSAMDKFVIYVPVPQGNGGSKDEWKVRLLDAGIDSTGVVDVFVSTSADPTKNELTGGSDPADMYQGLGSVTDYSKVTMIKLKSSAISNGQLITLHGKFTNAEIPADKINGAGLTAVSGIEYAYTLNGNPMTAKQDITARLVNTAISGKLFLDADEDGIMDKEEKGLADKTVRLYAKDGTEREVVRSNQDGYYTFSVPGISDGDYIMVDTMKDRRLTNVNMDADAAARSYFDPTTGQALPTLKNSEYLNAGFIEAPEIILDQDSYTIRMKKSEIIQYTISDGSTRDIKFESSDESIVMVDTDGVINTVGVGETTVKVYYTTISGIEVSSTIKIIVETNNKPEITAPAVLTMNVGDSWDALDPDIVEGLALSDDHDTVTVDDLTVTESVPVGSKFLFFFNTKDSGRLTTPGTYKVTYAYRDSDRNNSEHEMILKVNGQPYMEDLDGNVLTQDHMPDFFFRIGSSLDPLKDVKAFYDKASDKVGEDAVKTEISSTDTVNGVFTIKDPIDHEGNPVSGSPSKAGKYQGTYYIKTASEAKSTAELEMDRTLYAQGKIDFTGNSIAYSGTNPIKNYATWEEFYRVYKEKLDLKASVKTPLKDGTAKVNDLLSSVKVIDPDTLAELDFGTIDFTLLEGEKYKDIKLTLQVTDQGKADWDSEGKSVYGTAAKTLEIVVTVQDVVGEAPKITAKDIERVENDEIRDTTTAAPEKDLSTREEMAAAQSAGLHPLRDRLINDVTFSDDTTSPEKITKKIIEIRRTSVKADTSKKEIYDPDTESDIKEMMNTVGTYVITYEAIDLDGNRTVAERHIYVAGKTKFVSKIGLDGAEDEAVEASVEMLQTDTPYTPPNILAYHIDADEKTKHQTTVLADKNSVNAKKPGTFEVMYSTEHHYANYPDSATLRPKDTFTKKILVHGLIQLNTPDSPQILDYWVDETADLSGYKAVYLKAQDQAGVEPVETEVGITSDLEDHGLIVTSDKAAEINVTLHADAGKDSGIKGHEISFDRSIRFYGLPYITARGLEFTEDHKAVADIKEGMTEDEIKSLYKFYIKYAEPNGSVFENVIDPKNQITLTKVSDAKYRLSMKVSAAAAGMENTRYAEAEVELNVVSKPVISTDKDVYSYHIGDQLDLKNDTGLKISGGISTDDIEISYGNIKGEIPKDLEGKLKTPGTYKVVYSYTDYVGNYSEKTILIKVNGRPEIAGVTDMEKRVGDVISIWDHIQVNWMKAPETEGSAVSESFNYANATEKDAVLSLIEMKNEIDGTSVDFSALNQPGYYSGVYYAKSPSGAETRVKHTLLLQGRPEISANDIVISVNDEKPADFLTTYKDKLNISAGVSHAFNDKEPEYTDLTGEVTVNADKSDTIDYKTAGTYKVVLSVSDTRTVADSLNNTVEQDISVTIAEVVNADDLPDVSTPDRSRVTGDPIGKDDSGTADVASYLAEQPEITIKNGNAITNKKLTAAKKISGPSGNDLTDIDVKDNEALKSMMNTVGIYEAELELTDSNNNKIKVMQKWKIAGATEFGFGITDTEFKKLDQNAVLNVRQSEGNYLLSGIRARHQDPDGGYHYMGINENADVYDISSVAKHEISISSVHHYDTYENDPAMPRGADTLKFILLVQGRISINGIGDMHTRVGSKPDLLEGVSAVFDKIDEDGVIHRDTECTTLEASILDTSSVGIRTVTVLASDDETGALPKETTVTRTVYVESVPNLSFNEKYNVSKDADIKELQNGLQLEASYIDANGQKKAVSGSDIKIDFSGVDTAAAGKVYEISMTVSYDDNGAKKTITKKAEVYVLNDPAYIVAIPGYLELKDADDRHAEAKVDLELANGVDEDQSSVPAVEVYTDTEVTLEQEEGGDSYTAQTYLKDETTEYSSKDKPITVLKFGTAERDYFYLKTPKDDSKLLGKYKGVLHFIFGYEGD